jgi:hypothetical protein
MPPAGRLSLAGERSPFSSMIEVGTKTYSFTFKGSGSGAFVANLNCFSISSFASSSICSFKTVTHNLPDSG